MTITLRNESDLIRAEETLKDWATELAKADRAREAAEALKLADAILCFRCDFLESEKRSGTVSTGDRP